MRKHNALLKFCCLLWLAAGLTACYEPSEGCLDIRAANYDGSADNPCPDCCTFPKLRLVVAHNFGDEVFRYGMPYTLDGDQYFALSRIRFYVSNLRLSNGNETVGVTDSIDLAVYETGGLDTLTIEDNFALVSRDFSSFSYTIGTFRSEGSYNEISFLVGLDMIANRADPDTIDSSHPLAARNNMHIDRDEGYAFNRIELQRDTLLGTDTTQLLIMGAPRLVEVRLPFMQPITLGTDVEVKMKIDYSAWFKGINFVGDSEGAMIDQIVQNTAAAFSLLE